jgi:hypothetical protein
VTFGEVARICELECVVVRRRVVGNPTNYLWTEQELVSCALPAYHDMDPDMFLKKFI